MEKLSHVTHLISTLFFGIVNLQAEHLVWFLFSYLIVQFSHNHSQPSSWIFSHAFLVMLQHFTWKYKEHFEQFIFLKWEWRNLLHDPQLKSFSMGKIYMSWWFFPACYGTGNSEDCNVCNFLSKWVSTTTSKWVIGNILI